MEGVTGALGVHLLVAALAGTLLLGLYHGVREGLVRTAFKLAGFLAGLLLARPLAAALAPRLPADFAFRGSGLLLVLVCFVAIVAIVALIGWLIAKALSWTPLVWLDRLGGGLLGLGIGIGLAGLLLGILGRVGVAQRLLGAAGGWEADFLRALAAVSELVFGTLGRWGGGSGLPPGVV